MTARRRGNGDPLAVRRAAIQSTRSRLFCVSFVHRRVVHRTFTTLLLCLSQDQKCSETLDHFIQLDQGLQPCYGKSETSSTLPKSFEVAQIVFWDLFASIVFTRS